MPFFGALLVVTALLSSPVSVSQQNCESKIESAVRQIVLRDIPGDAVFSIIRTTRIACHIDENNENMADVAVLVAVGKNTFHYAVFHVHFTDEGRLLPYPGSDKKYWRKTSTPENLMVEWCDSFPETCGDPKPKTFEPNTETNSP